ncbi:C6 zinc finger domain protein [Aspergillus karnatakaensis]|uniref:Zn(II)2Cys6 transcription factor domain-containing protein n=1 Tax=Aspergillus karnatakaensis TaxID=1810916 RepID=UPI003CCD572D
MPVQRRLRRSPLECAQCTEGQMECSKARPACDECKSQQLSCRYRDQSFSQSPRRQSDARPRKIGPRKTKGSITSDSSRYSSPSPPPTDHTLATVSPSSSQSVDSIASEDNDEEVEQPPRKHDRKLTAEDKILRENWFASTERSLTHTKGKDQSWQSTIRREMDLCPAIHHGTLALSAMQLATASEAGSPKRKSHLQAAERHYRNTVESYPSEPSKAKCNAAFSAASILLMCELASSSLDGEGCDFSNPHDRSPSPGSQPDKEEKAGKEQTKASSSSSPSLPRLLTLFETIRSLSFSSGVLDIVENGQLKALFSQTDPYHQLPSTYTLTILHMRNLNAANAKADPSHETAVYNDAIGKLDHSLAMLSKGGEPTMIALRWMFLIPSRYIELVREKKPLALIIFAHYCAVLHHLRDRWWMGDWGTRLVKEISQLLGPERLASILWASDIVGIQT